MVNMHGFSSISVILTNYFFAFKSIQCMPHTWFLSPYVQMLVAALLLLLITGHKLKLTVNLLLITLLVALSFSFAVHAHYLLPPTLTVDHLLSQR